MPKVSIITVCYNEPDVKRTCESIVNQTDSDYEWLIIDGGSKPECLDILQSYKDKTAYFVSEKDSGIFNAMNKGIAKAQGEYLIFMNAGDEFFHPEVLRLVKPFLDGKSEIIYGDTQYINEDGTIDILSSPEVLNKEYYKEQTINHQSSFIRKDLFKSFGNYDENFPIFADIEKWLVYEENGCLFKHLPVIVAKFYRTGVSSKHTEKYYAERQKMWQKHNLD